MPDMPYRQFLDRVADGFFLHDDQGRLLDVNVQACTRLGYDRQALLGMSVQDIDRHTLHEMRTALWQGMAPDSQTIVVSRLRRSDASSFPVEIHLSCQWLDGRRLFFAIARDISERVRQDGQGRSLALSATVQDLFEREDAHARIEALADNLPNGAIYRLEGGLNQLRLSYISAGIENLIGVPAHAIMADRQVYLDAIHPEDLPLYQQMMQSSVDTLSVFDCRFRVLKPDGEIRWLRCRSAPRRCNEGMVWDGIMLDITREREAEQALRQAKEAAEAAERAKSDFLATMSHEIRTPMNTVIGMTRLVQQTALTSRQRVYLEKVERAASALLAVINDILDFSKIEAGMLVLEEVDFALDDVLETVSASTALRAEEKGLEVVYAMDPCLPRRLRGDPLRLGQVLTNLVGNAIKFTEHGEVVVSIHLMPPPAPADANTDADAAAPTPAHRLCVSVRDTGIGLDASRAERLFEPFTQADTQTTRRHGGTGLGLAICHRLVQLMGGEIGVSSQPGRGSSFRFTAKVRPTTDAPQCAPADLDGTRVLIVDDNDSARDALAAMVRKLGMRCDTAADGTQALRMLQEALRQESPYGLALLDWHMPGMDGQELARRIRGQRHLAATPAAFMATAFGCDEAQRHAAQLGLRGLLIKPLTASALQASIREALQDPASHQAEEPAAGPPPQQRYPGLPGRRVLVVDDNALNREVATELLEQAGISVQTAADGLQALQLLDSQPFDAVLMDVYMPGMDGLSAARAIRARSALRHLPVIALTAQAHEKDRAHIEAAGMNAYLTKPVDEVLLYETLQRCLPAAGPGPAALSKPSPSSTAPAPARLRQRLVGHAPRMRHVIEGFAQDFASAPQRLRDAARSGDWEAVAALAHTFKGSLGYLGADLLVRWSAMVETGARANLPGDGNRGDARPVGDMESLVQALADGLQGLLAEIAELSSGDAWPTLPTSPATQATPQQTPVNADEAPTTPARLQLQIADSDCAALAELEQLQPLIGERHALTDPELPTVLIVDDERLNRSLLAELLAPHYRVLLAEDGPGALVIANREAHRLQLILLDVGMPGMNGYEVLGALRAQERTAHIAVIFITGQSNAEAEEYGLRLGAADYVSKPIRPAVVEVRVRNQVRLALQRQALERLAMVDGLTGLANRRHFDDMLERAHRRSLRTGESLGLALIDIDHFKQYNDCYGHVQGDEALKAVAATLQRHARRPYDLAARFGGEEFALILPGESDAPAMAEHFRQEVLRLRIAHAASPTAPQLTVSCGVLTVRQPSCAPLEAWLQKVDGLLYQAKTWGRNRIAAAMEP